MSEDVYIFEREREFSKCLSEVIESFGVKTVSLPSYDEVFRQIEKGHVQMLICDLSDDEKTISFIRNLSRLHSAPCRIVFTSVFHDVSRWPELSNYVGPYLFISKPFSCQEMIRFLLPDAQAG